MREYDKEFRMIDLNKYGDRRNFVCESCSEELEHDEVMTFDLGTEILNVCEGCYEELRDEYGLIGDDDNYFYEDHDPDSYGDILEYFEELK